MHLFHKINILTILVLFMVLSCVKEADQINHCAKECDPPSETIRLSIVDSKDNSKSLIQESSASRIVLYSPLKKKEIPYVVEANSNYLVFQIYGTEEIEIKSGETVLDSIRLETKFINDGCCGSLSLVKIAVNNADISIPENRVIVLKR
ncbi:hypothetical protein [Pseudopedobacter beijingensis]|uniref:Lipoprotein n=1 Tax=Pseudopedobacter beijingensis TaxID=1207056 RepID=A0ABW4IHP1_9SPHI